MKPLNQVCWRYLFGADCIAEERTSAFACALCPLQCCSLEVRQFAALWLSAFLLGMHVNVMSGAQMSRLQGGQDCLAQSPAVAQGLMEHLDASHWRLHFAGAAGFLGADYLVEARVASDFMEDRAGYDAEANLASVTAEFERRFPTWQVRPCALQPGGFFTSNLILRDACQMRPSNSAAHGHDLVSNSLWVHLALSLQELLGLVRDGGQLRSRHPANKHPFE